MDAANLALAQGLVSASYISQGAQALASRHKLVKQLLSNRKLPEQGWDDATIEAFIQDCSMMDSNNFRGVVGVGEREGRLASDLVARRHFRLAHGIGRSGDIAAEQPKAAGSSLLAKLTTLLAADALREAGLKDLGAVSVIPVATGMALTLSLLAIKATRPAAARWVVWSRVDQKTCLKSITAAGLQPEVVELLREGDQLVTDVAAIRAAVERLGCDNVVAIVTTTSCFAPRACDDVVGVAKLCAQLNVPHMINNAYGVQSSSICCHITSAWRKGRVDVVVQSTDKNFMVPVGGALVVEGVRHTGIVAGVNTAYPGRAAMSAHLDLLITLLHWGRQGWRKVLQEREALYPQLQHMLAELAPRFGQRLLHVPGNPISCAVTLDPVGPLGHLRDPTFLGAKLWARNVCGMRVVGRGKQQQVAGITFHGYGAHTNDYPHTYLTAAAALGGSCEEAEEFCARLAKVLQAEVVAGAALLATSAAQAGMGGPVGGQDQQAESSSFVQAGRQGDSSKADGGGPDDSAQQALVT